MDYNMDFLISALVFLLLILYHFLEQRKPGQANSRAFLFFMAVGIADILFDLISTILISWGDPHLRGATELSLLLLYLMQVLLPYTLFLYTQSLRRTARRVRPVLKAAWAVPAVLMELMVLGNHWSGLLFRVDAQGIYSRGPLYLATYLHALFYVLLCALSSILRYRELGPKRFASIWEFLIIVGTCVAVQAAFNYLLVTGFGISLGIAVLFLTINNPYQYTDNLTGVLDVQCFREIVQEKMVRGKKFHLLSVDLHQIKQVNMVLGTGAGNQMLMQAAQALQEASFSDLVFRVTGKRFLVILHTLEEYVAVRGRIQQHFSAISEQRSAENAFPVVICGVFDGELLGESDVLLAYLEYLISSVPRSAETTLIQGDEKTLRGFRYTQEIERFLDTALEQDLFEVYYQPVYSTEAGGYVSLEALSRLRHPNLGAVPPEVFIGIAEKNNRIAKIGLLQFRRVCRFIKDHPSLMTGIRNVKFNLSPAELLKSGYSRDLIGLIREYELSPSYFQFEITETVATRYSEDLYRAVTEFTQAGIGLCLDDFGSGYANLNTVLQLPFSEIKLDKSLLSGICDTPKIASFYRNIVSVLQDMGYQIVSEGGETKQELDLVCRWGVTMIQGYYFSKPLSEAEILHSLHFAQNSGVREPQRT